MPREVRSLTGLRGAAAMLVMMYHFTRSNIIPLPFTPGVVKSGYLAVDVFYILSGFVIALSYSRIFRNSIDRSSLYVFLIKRLARIYPGYLAIMAYAVASALIRHRMDRFAGYDAADYLGNLLLLQGWGLDISPIIGASWSISAELFAYLVFPLLVVLLLRGGPMLSLPALVGAGAGIVAVESSGLGVDGPLDVVNSDSLLPLLRCLCGFVIGVLLNRAAGAALLKPILSSRAGALAILAALLSLLTIRAPDFAIYALLPFLVLMSYYEGAVIRALLANRLIHQIGTVSYSLYLVHAFVQGGAMRLASELEPRLGEAGRVAAILLASVAAWALATLGYRLIEVPGRRLMERLFRLRAAAPARTAVAA